MSELKRLFYTLVIIGFLAFIAAVGAAFYALDYYDKPGPLPAASTVVFKRGEGFHGILSDLTQHGVISNPLLFKAIAVVLGRYSQFKAGEYNFSAAMTPHAIMDMIAGGKVVVHKVTIPEGLTVRDITKILMSDPALEGDVPANIKEGSLMPETYHYMYGDSRESVIKQMQTAMTTLMTTLWPKRKEGLPFDTPEQALTLASIVEKETGLRAERGHVASVFINRLRKGMKLQSDPTVVYGFEQQAGMPIGRPLTSEDLRSETPYNTYTIPGLPPTPIANPGRASIESVLNPPDTDDIYFVATGVGGHNFASTLEQHNHNVQLYRQKIAR